jgi:hypothetical protein
MAYRSLPKFNPEGRFIVNRPFLYNGQTLQPGELVEGILTRRLRQLYGVRHVIAAPPAAQHKEAAHAARKGTK